MNRTRVAAFVLSCLLVICCAKTAVTQDQVRGYDWEVLIKTEPLKDYLSYSGSSFHPIIKAAVTYKESGKGGVTQYEDLWYRGCDPVGSKRYHRFQIRSGDGVAIKVSHKNNSVENAETCAAANAIVRLLLDSYLNGNSVIAAIVPGNSFSQISSNLQRENFYVAGPATPDQPEFSSIVIELQSEPPGNKQTLHYAGKTY
jgi:hypothetical protein